MRKALIIFSHAIAIFTVAVIVLLSQIFPIKYKNAVEIACDRFGVDQALCYAVIKAESGFNPRAISNKGAIGLMQLMPSTAKWCAERLGIEYDENLLLTPEYNINLGVYYLSYLMQKFDEKYAICAYNAGEGNVKKWQNGEILFPETRAYYIRINIAKSVYNIKIK